MRNALFNEILWNVVHPFNPKNTLPSVNTNNLVLTIGRKIGMDENGVAKYERKLVAGGFRTTGIRFFYDIVFHLSFPMDDGVLRTSRIKNGTEFILIAWAILEPYNGHLNSE